MITLRKELKNQRRRYKIKEVYWEGNNEGDKGVYGSSHHHIVISYIEDDGVFYVMKDSKEGRMGQTIRYEFKIIDYHKTTNQSDYKIELLDRTMTMIR